MLEYRALVLLDLVAPGMTVKKALSIYKKWHLLQRQPTWGNIPFSCSCVVCFAHCVCQDALLLASLFDPNVRVPANWVAATVTLSARKLCKSIGGTAGRKRRKLIEERACDEKAIDSKVKYLKFRPTKQLLVLPSAEETVMPSSDEALRYSHILQCMTGATDG